MEYYEAMDQLTRLRSLMAAGGDDSVFSADDRAIIEELHLEEFGQKVRDCGCMDRYTDAVVVLYSRLRRLQTMQKDQKYLLRSGVIIWIGTEAYSRHNLTDKVAKAYLKKHPEDKRKFERLPEDEQPEAAAEA